MKTYYNLTIIVTVLSFTLSINAQNNSKIYVSPHPDDWQLFMTPNAYNDIKNTSHKVIFIHTTSGDAGFENGNNSYYLAREKGSLRALRFISNIYNSNATLGTDMNETIVAINGHEIRKFSYNNIIAYFLRLPDGNIDGSGFPLQNFSSLEKLYNDSSSSISAIDGSTTYSSLNDLKNTLLNLIQLETNNSDSISFNIADDDLSINPGDHSDHIYSSKIIQEVAQFIGHAKINLYTEYCTDSKTQNIFGKDYLVSAGTWAVTASGLSDNLHANNWNEDHNAWIGKQYYRTISIKPGNLASNKPTNCSNNEESHPSSNAVDNDYSLSNWWGASPFSQWWQVDLQDTFNINKIVVINYYDGTRYYQYDIEASLDGNTWTSIADFNNNTTPATSEGNTFDINATARYLKVNMNFNSANNGVHIIEFEAYGELFITNLSSNIIENNKVMIYPNPINQGSELTLNLENLNSKVVLEVNDLSGKTLLKRNYDLTEKNNSIKLNTHSFSKGCNTIKLTTKEKAFVRYIYIY